MARITLFLMILTAAAFASGEPTPPEVREVRPHQPVFGTQGAVLYDVTHISKSSQATFAAYLLVRDTGHGAFVIRHIWSFKDQLSMYRMSDLKDRTFVQITAKLPFSSKTRQETLEESRRNPTLKMIPAIVKLETNSGRWEAVETDWADADGLRQFRNQVRQSIDFFLLEAIERMRGTPVAGSVAD